MAVEIREEGVGDIISYLTWRQRPVELKQAVDDAFDKLKAYKMSFWGCYNGDRKYKLCGIDEHVLMKRVIKSAPERKRQFYVLDIGAGDFQWSFAMADFVNHDREIPGDITVNIIGVRAEGYSRRRIEELGKCKIYSLGAFKVEELVDQFKREGLDLENRVDLIVSRWCFRHLADPVGTFVQAYDLLCPKTGYFLFDGFSFLFADEMGGDKKRYNDHMVALLHYMHVDFVQRIFNDCCSSLNHFMVRRVNDSPCHLHISYVGVSRINDEHISSGCITRFCLK
jgi:hypothetical protein